MTAIEKYYHWFFLSSQASNYQLSMWEKDLRVAPIDRVSKYKGLSIDNSHFVFTEKNTKWDFIYFRWLREFLWIDQSNLPSIFICDNHNHVLSFRYHTLLNKHLLWERITLIHIDQHSDCRDNNYQLDITQEPNEIYDFVNNKCNVWNFILPALQSWLISNQVQIRSNKALKDLIIEDNKNFILDIDLDFCLLWINRNKIDKEIVQNLKEKFNKVFHKALCITIATSPYFLNQDIAIELVNDLLN